MNVFANTEGPDEMQHNAAFHQGLHFLLSLNNLQGLRYILIRGFKCMTP